MRVKLHHEGVNILIVALIVLLLINVPVWFVFRNAVLSIVLGAESITLYMVMVN